MRTVYALLEAIRGFLDDVVAIRQSVADIASQKESEQQQPEIKINVPSTIHVKAEVTEPEPIRKEKHTTDNRRFRLNLGIQSAMALFTFGAFIAATYYACITARMWKEMRTQTETAQKQLEATERPWIKLIDVQTRGNNPIVPALSFQFSPVYSKGSAQTTFQLDISYENVGHSVARVDPDPELFLEVWSNGYGERILKESKRFCDSSQKIDSNASVIVYPNDGTKHWYGSGAAVATPDKFTHVPQMSGVDFIIPEVVVCIDYKFGDTPKVYQTRALYEVFRKDNKTRFFEFGRNFPERQIFMIRNPLADEAN